MPIRNIHPAGFYSRLVIFIYTSELSVVINIYQIIVYSILHCTNLCTHCELNVYTHS